jgi:hypothetical protein
MHTHPAAGKYMICCRKDLNASEVAMSSFVDIASIPKIAKNISGVWKNILMFFE